MTANTEQIALWNSEATSAWASAADRYDAMLQPLGAAVQRAAALQAGEAVLDVGCGTGQLSRAAGDAVGAQGRVLGVDIANPLLEVARQRTQSTHVAYELADAQCDDLGRASFDAVISRFGVMFFDDPVAAFANLRRAARGPGRLAFVCWQPLFDNPWALTAVLAVAEHVPLPAPPQPGTPGPFAFGDRQHVQGVLEGAGWQDVQVQPNRSQIAVYGAATADEAARGYREDAFGKTLFAAAEADSAQRAEQALAEALRPYEQGQGVLLEAATWIVTARC